MQESELRRLVLTALFIAMVAVATMVINVPMVATQGFINVGDTMIFVAAVMMGRRMGLLAGGLGSALADLLLGYTHWAPWTLVIKGIEGFIAGQLGYANYQREKRLNLRIVAALIISAAWMVFAYYIAGGIMQGFPAALSSVPGNMLQGGGSVILSLPLLHALRGLKL